MYNNTEESFENTNNNAVVELPELKKYTEEDAY